MPEPRANITLRLSAEEVAPVDQMAEQEKRTRSQMLRVLVDEAVRARQKKR